MHENPFNREILEVFPSRASSFKGPYVHTCNIKQMLSTHFLMQDQFVVVGGKGPIDVDDAGRILHESTQSTYRSLEPQPQIRKSSHSFHLN